jgi:hypothetical protein
MSRRLIEGEGGVIHEVSFAWVVAFACIILVYRPAHADWLASQAKIDGSYSAPGELATPTQATAGVVRTLRLLGRGAEVAPADAFLAAEPYHGTEYLARKILSGASAGSLDSALVLELITHQNANGGLPESQGCDSNLLDTAFALEALSFSGNSNSPAVSPGVSYLLQQQSADRSWLDRTGASDTYAISLAPRALIAYRSQLLAIGSAVANASTFLVSQ